jgi:hypothetical protein
MKGLIGHDNAWVPRRSRVSKGEESHESHWCVQHREPPAHRQAAQAEESDAPAVLPSCRAADIRTASGIDKPMA